MADTNNLLVRLHRWAKANRQDENFTTEAFVHVLQHLLDHEPKVAVSFLAFLTGSAVDLGIEEAATVRLKTQVTIDAGRPDVEIQTTRHRAFLEAKVESGVRKRQLEDYLSELDKTERDKWHPKRTALILLTRYPVPTEILPTEALGEKRGIRIHCIRWYEVADWLADELAAGTIRDSISRHTVGQFLGFLSARGMKMEKVDSEMIQGVRAMRNFTKMLEEAIAASKLSATPSVSAEGFGLYLERGIFRIGFAYESPQELWFATQVQIDPEKGENVGCGEVYEFKGTPGGYQWGNCLKLTEDDFFAHSLPNQMRCLEKFIRGSLAAARQVLPSGTGAPAASDPGGETDIVRTT